MRLLVLYECICCHSVGYHELIGASQFCLPDSSTSSSSNPASGCSSPNDSLHSDNGALPLAHEVSSSFIFVLQQFSRLSYPHRVQCPWCRGKTCSTFMHLSFIFPLWINSGFLFLTLKTCSLTYSTVWWCRLHKGFFLMMLPLLFKGQPPAAEC